MKFHQKRKAVVAGAKRLVTSFRRKMDQRALAQANKRALREFKDREAHANSTIVFISVAKPSKSLDGQFIRLTKRIPNTGPRRIATSKEIRSAVREINSFLQSLRAARAKAFKGNRMNEVSLLEKDIRYWRKFVINALKYATQLEMLEKQWK